MAVVVQTPFFKQLPKLPVVERARAEIAWLTYDLNLDASANRHKLELAQTHYTKFQAALNAITVANAGDMGDFVKGLEQRIKKGQFYGTPPASELPPDVEPGFGLSDETEIDPETF